MSKTTRPLYALLLSSVSAIDGTAHSVEDARFVARLAATGDIPADKLREVAGAVDKKMSELMDSAGDHVAESHHLLQQARAGVTAQIDFYQSTLAAINKDQLTLGIDDINVAPIIDKSIGGASRNDVVHHPAAE